MRTKAIKAKETNRTKGGDPPADLVTLKKLRVVIRAAQRHSAWVEKQCGVSGAQLWIMQELHDTPGLRIGEVAHKLAVHQTTVSNLVDDLVKRDYAVKKRDPDDQRAVKLELSERGSSLLVEAPRPARGVLPEALRQLEPQQLAQLDESLKNLLDSIGLLDDGYGLQSLAFTV